MNDFRQPSASDFHANSLPTLNGWRGQIPCLFSERFNTQQLSLGNPAYPQGMFFGPEWGIYNPVGLVGQAFVDATEKCGVLGVQTADGVGTQGLVGVLRNFPKVRNQAALIAANKQIGWQLFSRVGLWSQSPASAENLPKLVSGLLVSTTDLPNVDGESVLAGGFQSEVGFAAWYASAVATNASATLATVGAAMYAKTVIIYDPASDISFVSPFASGDGVGFVGPGVNLINPGDMVATILLKGLPKVFGLGLDLRGLADPLVDGAYMRMDYLHVFGASLDAFNASPPAVAEGGQTFVL
jgi:hypothetical protein